MPIIEIVTFCSTEEFLNDPLKTGHATFRKTIQAEGCYGIYVGTQVEDQKTGYLIVVWESYEHHKRFSEQADYPELAESLKPCFSGSIDAQHIDPNVDSMAAFEAPVTEFGVFKLKPEKTKEDAILIVQKIVTALDNMKDVIKPTVWGASREHPDTLILCAGWPSKQVHLESARSSEELKSHIGDLRVTVKPSAVHIHFKKYVPQ